MDRVKNTPDVIVYGTSSFSQEKIVWSRRIVIIISILIIIIALVLDWNYISWFTIAFVSILAVILYAILSYLNWSHNYFKLYVSNLGIANETKWVTGAMTWDQIEIVEVKLKHGKIDYILLRCGMERLGTRSSFFARQLTLEVVSEKLGGIEAWHLFEDINDTTDADIFYARPDMSRTEAKEKIEDLLLFEWIGEQDYDAEQTQEHITSRSDDELYELIIDDPKCVWIKDSSRLTRMTNNIKVQLILFITPIVLLFSAMSQNSYGFFYVIIAIVLLILLFHSFLKFDERLIISPIGIVRYIWGSPEAIEWQHIEFIDLVLEENEITQAEFYGNKRRIFCPSHAYRGRFTIDIIRNYIPDFDNWNRIRKERWEEEQVRFVRPEV